MKRTFIILVLVLLTFVACQKDKDEIEVSREPDQTGNLYITNRLNDDLLLYRSGKPIREIPAAFYEFLIYIPNNGQQIELRIWKKDEVADYSNPDGDKLYKKWSIVLSPTTDKDKRLNWTID